MREDVTVARLVRLVGTRWLAAIGVVALVVRVIVVIAQPLRVLDDAADYQRLAVLLAHGHGFGASVVAPGGGPTAFRPPLYPLALSVLYRTVGVHVGAARIVAATLGAVSVALIVLTTALLWGRTVALAAGVIAAFYPSMVLASTSVMSESVAIPLELATVGGALMHRRTGRRRWLAVCGVALGLAVLARPNLAVLAVAVVLLLGRGERTRTRLAPAAVTLVMAAIVVAPWLVRDRLVMHQWVPITTQDGLVLAGTYNSTSYSDHLLPAGWRPATLDPADAALIHAHPHATETQLSALLLRSSQRFIAAHPSYVATVVGFNSARLFDLGGGQYTRRAVVYAYGYPSVFGAADMVGCFVVALLASAGMCTRRARRVPVAYWAVPVLLWGTTVVIEVLPRLRAVIDPFLVQAAAVGVAVLWQHAGARLAVTGVVRAPGPARGARSP